MKRLFLFLICLAAGFPATVDRLALVVGKTAFTQSEIEQEVRLGELEAGKPLDLSAARRKDAAERLVDQQLLRDEIAATQFQPPEIQPASLLTQFCQEHFAAMPACASACARYGVSESAVSQHLLWEVTLVRFTDQRFAPIAPADGDQKTDGAGGSVDTEMAAWLKERRAATRIVFNQEAFQ